MKFLAGNLPACSGVVLSLLVLGFGATGTFAQSSSPSFAFRPGQSIYIVAFRRVHPSSLDAINPKEGQEYSNLDLDAERKIRKRIEDWTFFSVVDKLSQADFVFLVNLDESSIEGLAIPVVSYQDHFKEKFDLDALRESAYGRYLIGPLKFPSISRLSDRLVEQFRDKARASNKRSGR